MHVWHKTKRGREVKAPETWSQKKLNSPVCACMNENAASLQPADYWLWQPRRGAAPVPPYIRVYVLYIVSTLTKRHADHMLRSVCVKQL